jgi:hypothetical protein
MFTLDPSERFSIDEIPRAAADSLTVCKASSSAVVSSLAVEQLKPSRWDLAQSTGYFLVALARKNEDVAGATAALFTTPVISDLNGPVGKASN